MPLFRSAQECGYVYGEWEALCKFSLNSDRGAGGYPRLGPRGDVGIAATQGPGLAVWGKAQPAMPVP